MTTDRLFTEDDVEAFETEADKHGWKDIPRDWQADFEQRHTCRCGRAVCAGGTEMNRHITEAALAAVAPGLVARATEPLQADKVLLERELQRALDEVVAQSRRLAAVEAAGENVGMHGAIRASLEAHTYATEVPDEGEPYIWCVCGWRSDDETNMEGAGRHLFTHLTNAMHTAVREHLRAALSVDPATPRPCGPVYGSCGLASGHSGAHDAQANATLSVDPAAHGSRVALRAVAPPDSNLDVTRAALRREIGPETERDASWQPMVSAAEIRLLLDALDAAEAVDHG